MSNQTRYEKWRIAVKRVRIADDAKNHCEQEYLRAVYAQSLSPITPADAARNIRDAHMKMIEARKEYDAAMTAYSEMINHD